jgi:glycosyltransferase involved in cell wall biosynthesis
MRVGVKIPAEFGLVSVQKLFASFYQALAASHELVFLPPDHPYVPLAERRRMADAFIQECDVVAGVLDPGLIAARRRLGSDVPFVFFALGEMPIGAWTLRGHLKDLTTRDVVLVNCGADLEIAHRLFHNATVRVVPFPVSTADFFPLGAEERRAARAALGFGDHERVILYAGRITPEKNVHTLLKIFGVVGKRVSNAHLLVAGDVWEGGGAQWFNVGTVRFPRTVAKIASRLELPEGRFHRVGHSDARRMRELYNAADVVVNLTLNPDENFGLGQVEAMACGTPVVGTAWGGLKDTIADGETGYSVSTVFTPWGPRFNWWEAINRIVEVLEDGPARARFRQGCLAGVGAYTPESFAALVGEIVSSAARAGAAEPLRATEFAGEFWSACDPGKPGAAFRRDPQSKAMYHALAGSYAGVSAQHVAAGEALEDAQVLSLTIPVDTDGEGGFRLDDTLYPFPIEVPAAHEAGVRAVLEALRGEPAITVGDLLGARLAGEAHAASALGWMLATGLVLRSRPVAGWIAPALVDRRLAEVQFAVQHVDREHVDLLAFREEAIGSPF